MIVPCILLWFNMISIRFRRGSAHPRLAKRQENRSSKTQHPKAFILWPSDAIRIGAQPWHFMAFHGISWHFISFSWPYTKLWLWDTLSLSTGHPLWPQWAVAIFRCELCGWSPLTAASEELLVVALLGGLEVWRRASAPPKHKLHRKSCEIVDEKAEKPETHSCHSSWDETVYAVIRCNTLYR